jgi:hypothetical protein
VDESQLEALLAEIEGLSDDEVQAQLAGSGDASEEPSDTETVKATRKTSHE